MSEYYKKIKESGIAGRWYSRRNNPESADPENGGTKRHFTVVQDGFEFILHTGEQISPDKKNRSFSRVFHSVRKTADGAVCGMNWKSTVCTSGDAWKRCVMEQLNDRTEHGIFREGGCILNIHSPEESSETMFLRRLYRHPVEPSPSIRPMPRKARRNG